MGTAYAKVFPLPVCDLMRASFPLNTTGMAFD
jgi:hypothetical protein